MTFRSLRSTRDNVGDDLAKAETRRARWRRAARRRRAAQKLLRLDSQYKRRK